MGRSVTGMLIDSDRLRQAILTTMPERSEVLLIVDSQPDGIVRCKDCKYRFVDGDNVRFNMCLLNHNKVQQDDWFCADGERKDNDNG